METVNDISKKCQNCGAPYTGDRCGYCGTWHGDEPENKENDDNNFGVGFLCGVLWLMFIILIPLAISWCLF